MKHVWWWLALVVWLTGTFVSARNETPSPAARSSKTKPAVQAARPSAAPAAATEPETTGKAAPTPLPADLEKPTAGELAGDPPAATVMSEKDLAAYFAARPKTFLIDPQKLLDAQTTRDQLDFLKGHADDSTIDLFIYVFKGEQEIPGDVREEEVAERFFASGRPAVIVYYFLGAPQQAVLYLSPALTEVVTVAEQRRALQGAVKQALAKSSPQEQLQVFSGHLANRIYGMERLLGDAATGGDAESKSAQARAAKLPKKSLSLGERWVQMRPLAEELAVPGLLLGSLLAAATGLFVWLRSRATYRLPEIAVEPRLGGDHAAGVGAIISFASAALPPAAQCEQVADRMRRP